MVQLEGEILLRLMEIRRTLENDVVRKAILAATPTQRQQISELCDALLLEVDADCPDAGPTMPSMVPRAIPCMARS
ncbi:MAG: hypothetical protein MO846_09060 [Candidatus Devosia symbiotica]|nr:hypothetical protein [Candidatus Devosia symbiotica]